MVGAKGRKEPDAAGPPLRLPLSGRHTLQTIYGVSTLLCEPKLCLNYGYILPNFIHHSFCICIHVFMCLFGQLLISHCVPEKICDKLPKYMLQNINRRHLRIKEAKSKIPTQKYIPELLKMGQKFTFRLPTN